MEKSNLLNNINIETVKKLRKIFLRLAVWILIAELVLGAILILTQSWDIMVGRIQGTFLIIALVLFVSVNNFVRIEKGNKTIKNFALIGFFCNIIWAIFAFLLMWEIVPFYWIEEVEEEIGFYGKSFAYNVYHMTAWSMIMAIFAYAAAACFWISNVMSIKENIKLVKPLKITAIVCVYYCWIFGTIMTITEPNFEDVVRLYQLAGLAGLAFVITSLAAVIISRTNRKKAAVEVGEVAGSIAAPSVSKTDEELRAEIEERVRREMIEKEVRAKMEAEKAVAGGSEAPTNNPQIESSEKIVEDSFKVKD